MWTGNRRVRYLPATFRAGYDRHSGPPIPDAIFVPKGSQAKGCHPGQQAAPASRPSAGGSPKRTRSEYRFSTQTPTVTWVNPFGYARRHYRISKLTMSVFAPVALSVACSSYTPVGSPAYLTQVKVTRP